MREEREIERRYREGQLDRREFIKLMLGLGVSLPAIGTFLAACAAAPAPSVSTPAPQPAATAPAAVPPAGAAATAVPTAATAPTGSQQFVIAAAKEALGLDPVQQNDADSTFIQGLIHDSVAIIDPQFNVKPQLAESWNVSSDGLTYTYKFRTGVKFHDGSVMTADDVVFTLDRILANKYPEGAKAQKINMISSYQKIDDQTVEIKLKFVYAPFAAAFGNMFIVPKAYVQKVGDQQFTKAPVGCGPFKFVEWVPNDHVRVDAFADYWLVKPNLSRVTARPISENSVAVANLLSGDVDAINDVVGPNLKQLQQASDKVTVYSKASLSYYWAGFRMLTKPYTDVRFRQAVIMATDFDAAVQAIFPPELAVRAYSTIPPGLWPDDSAYMKANAYKQDKAKAKQLFDALISEGVMAKDFEIVVAPPPDDARISVAEVMVTDLKQLGMNATLWHGDWAAHSDLTLQTKQNVIFLLGTIAAIPDPDANIRWLFGSEGQHAGYLNVKIDPTYQQWDDMIHKAEQSQSHDERAQLYTNVERHMLIEAVYHIPLYYKNTIMAARNYVKNFNVSQNFSSWDLVKPWANVYMQGKA